MSDNLYARLGLEKGATSEEIKKAHRKLVKTLHPDTEEGDAEKFKEVQEAYEILSDPVKRKEYDETGIYEDYKFTDPEIEIIVSFAEALKINRKAELNFRPLINPINEVKKKLKKDYEEGIEHNRKLQGHIKSIERVLQKLKRKPGSSGRDFLTRSCQNKIKSFQKNIEFNNEIQKILKEALDLIKDYSYEEDPQHKLVRNMFALNFGGGE